MGLVVALLGGILLGANASPALASDGIEPPFPPVAEAGDLVASLESMSEMPSAEDITIAVPVLDEEETGGADAAPERDAGVSKDPGTALPTVVSPAIKPDITPVTAPEQAAESSRPEERKEDEPLRAEAEESVGVPTLPETMSPSLSAATAALDALHDDATSTEAAQAADRAPAGATEPERDAEPVQYHGDDTRYQSDEISPANSWTWEWYLELDCSGIVANVSSEIGDTSAEEWTWIWNWKWTCGLEGGSEEARDELRASAPVVTTDPAPTRPDPQQQQQDAGEGDGWVWTWTFAFCGHTTTISTRTASDSMPRWIWDWTWEWACTAAAEDGDGDEGDATPDPTSDNPDPSEALPWIDELMGGEGAIGEAVGSILVGPAPPIAASLLSWFFDPSTAIPMAVPNEAAPSAGAGGDTRRAIPHSPRALVPAAPRGVSSTPAANGAPEHQPEAVGAQDGTSRSSATPRPRHPNGPLQSPARRAVAPSSSSASAPGGTGAAGSAALTGFIVLAAPGLGRRIREARELSPRAPVRARLERPG